MSAWNWILLLAVSALWLAMLLAVGYMASANESRDATPLTETQ